MGNNNNAPATTVAPATVAPATVAPATVAPATVTPAKTTDAGNPVADEGWSITTKVIVGLFLLVVTAAAMYVFWMQRKKAIVKKDEFDKLLASNILNPNSKTVLMGTDQRVNRPGDKTA